MVVVMVMPSLRLPRGGVIVVVMVMGFFFIIVVIVIIVVVVVLYLLNPCCRSGYFVKVEFLGIYQFIEVNITIVALNDVCLRL